MDRELAGYFLLISGGSRGDPPLVLDPRGLDDPPLPPLSEGLDPQMLTYPFR